MLLEVSSGAQETERVKIHPNQYLNEYVAFYVLKYLQSIGFERTGSKINTACFDFLEKSRIPLSRSPEDLEGRSLVEKAASIQKQLVMMNPDNFSLREAVRSNPDLRPLASFGGQALMISSYRPLFENLLAVDSGQIEYGYGRDIYRLQPDNAYGAGIMMKPAAERIAKKVADLYADLDNLALLEFGSGNAMTLAIILNEFEKRGLRRPKVIASDIDPRTSSSAKELFKRKGLGEVNWESVDMGSEISIAWVAKKLEGKNVIIFVGYIYHENRELARRSLEATSKIMPNTVIAASEYFLPPSRMGFDQSRPYWFEAVHAMTQDLFEGRNNFLEFAEEVGGYTIIDGGEVVHQKLDGLEQPLNSTVFLKKRQF